MHRTQRSSEILDIPYFLTYAGFPIGCVIMIVNYSLSVYIRFFSKRNEETE
jgi:TRAP-type C4-dicarboxylate transport system permease small subunit